MSLALQAFHSLLWSQATIAYSLQQIHQHVMNTLFLAYLNACLYELLNTRPNDCAVNVSRRRPDIFSRLRFNSPPKIDDLREAPLHSDLYQRSRVPFTSMYPGYFLQQYTVYCLRSDALHDDKPGISSALRGVPARARKNGPLVRL